MSDELTPSAAEPTAIDDDALEMVTGGIKLCSTPSTCNASGSGGGYSTNSTIYFQTSIPENVT